jgi:hypothetical protein
MPITKTGIGHSSATIDKQIGLSAILQQHFSIVTAVMNKHTWIERTFFYIDAYAGDGFNAEENVDGSPLIFRKNSSILRNGFKAYFIDEVTANINKLRSYGWPSQYELLSGDNAMLVPQLIKNISKICAVKKMLGLIYCDPNTIPDISMLKTVSTYMPKMDILIRMNVTAGKRGSTRIENLISSIGKKVWIIRGPQSSDHWQWSFLLGTDYVNFKPWSKKGFHRLDSKKGYELFNKLNYTEKEKKDLGIRIPKIEPTIENYNLF